MQFFFGQIWSTFGICCCLDQSQNFHTKETFFFLRFGVAEITCIFIIFFCSTDASYAMDDVFLSNRISLVCRLDHWLIWPLKTVKFIAWHTPTKLFFFNRKSFVRSFQIPRPILSHFHTNILFNVTVWARRKKCMKKKLVYKRWFWYSFHRYSIVRHRICLFSFIFFCFLSLTAHTHTVKSWMKDRVMEKKVNVPSCGIDAFKFINRARAR